MCIEGLLLKLPKQNVECRPYQQYIGEWTTISFGLDKKKQMDDNEQWPTYPKIRTLPLHFNL